MQWHVVLIVSMCSLCYGSRVDAASKDGVLLRLPLSSLVRSGQRVGKKKLASLVVRKRMLEVRQLRDHQYKRRMKFRVVALDGLLSPWKKRFDVALLQFRNGMVIPYPLRASVPKGGRIFIAFSFWSRKQRAWSRAFPPLLRAGKRFADMRPQRFQGHKLVMVTPWHPLGKRFGLMPLTKSSRGFQPWSRADSLRHITLTTRALHRSRYPTVGRLEREVRGRSRFFQLCQFCHSVAGAGARFGIDFVTPYPVHLHRRSMSLLWHVRYRSLTSVEHGAMMPAIKGMTRRDATDLWYWLRVASRQTVAKPSSRPTKRSK